MDLLTKIQAQFSLARETRDPSTRAGGGDLSEVGQPRPPSSSPLTNRNIHNGKNNNNNIQMTLWGGKQARNNESN